MKNGKASLLLALLLAAIVIAAGRLYYRLTDDFRIGTITYNFPYHPEWETEALCCKEEKELDAILSQGFTYLGKGAQSYAFASDDGRYVIKFFKFKHLTPSLLLRAIPDIPLWHEWLCEKYRRKEERFNNVFNGYKLAYDKHRTDSSLVYLHLNLSQNLQRTLHVTDKLGFQRAINLDDVIFVIQEKGTTSRTVINGLLVHGDVDGAVDKIEQIFQLYLREYHKGIYDCDHGVMHNTGFVGNRPFHLDIGKLTADEKMKSVNYFKDDLTKVATKINFWLQLKHPQYSETVAKAMEKRLTQIFGEPFFFNEVKYTLATIKG